MVKGTHPIPILTLKVKMYVLFAANCKCNQEKAYNASVQKAASS